MTSPPERDQLEKQIVSLLHSGDQQAISLIYKNYANTLMGLIYKVVKSDVIAEEVLQDTFVKIWKNAAQYNPQKGRLFTWFANIARNAAIDKVRSASFQRQSKTDQTENFVDIKEAGQEIQNISDPGLRKVIDSLDDKYRRLIDLVYFQGYTQREIEKEFEIPLGTVKSRLRAADKELRAKLDNENVRKLLFVLLLISLFIHLMIW